MSNHAVFFERVATGAIIANVGVLLAGLVVDDGYEPLFELLHDVLLGIFALELAVRLRAGGWGFLRRPLNALDAAVIAVSFLPALGVDASLLRLARAARLLHLAKHLAPHLRMLRFMRVGTVPVAAAMLVALAVAAPTHADDDGSNDPDTTQVICGAYRMGVPQDRIPGDLGRNGQRQNLWKPWRETNDAIVGGNCG